MAQEEDHRPDRSTSAAELGASALSCSVTTRLHLRMTQGAEHRRRSDASRASCRRGVCVRTRHRVPAGRFPSGQRGQTVNLMAQPSTVRIRLSPPAHARAVREVPAACNLNRPFHGDPPAYRADIQRIQRASRGSDRDAPSALGEPTSSVSRGPNSCSAATSNVARSRAHRARRRRDSPSAVRKQRA